MTPEQKLELDLRDLWRLWDGVEAYVTLDAKAMMERLRAHKEDAFCEVSNSTGDGKLMCTRDGYDAIIDLAERHRDSLPVPDDYSVKELADVIRSQIIRASVEEKQDEPTLARVLAAAVNEANKNHTIRTYHFPCVITQSDQPPQFRIGPVTFTSSTAFPTLALTEIKAYIDGSRDKEWAAKRVEEFHKYCCDQGWVASVTVPPCSEESSKRRAELAVNVAINLLRLAFGIPYGRRMRLAHSAPSNPRHTEYATQIGNELNFISSRKGTEGALIEDGWHLAMDEWKGYWIFGAHLVSTALEGIRSEVANRVIDALTWFGEAAFESVPGIQIVNFVAALERLTTVGRFGVHSFCSNVALLAYETDEEFEKTYWNAHAIYMARSHVMHGTLSPTDPTFLKTLRLAHDVTRTALFRGLEVHCVLDDGGEHSDLADLRNFLAKQTSKWAPVLKKLGDEAKKKKETFGGR